MYSAGIAKIGRGRMDAAVADWSVANSGCGRDDVFWMNIPVALQSHEGKGTGWVHGGAHFLGGIVQVHPPLGVSNAVIQRSV